MMGFQKVIKLENLLESIPYSIVATDLEGRIVSCNSATQKTFGYNPEELIGIPITSLLIERHHKLYREVVKKAQEKENFINAGEVFELVGINRNGGEFPIELSLSTWKSEGKRHFTSIIRDSTKRKRLEESLINEKIHLLSAQEELLKKHEELCKLFKQVEKAKKEWESTMDCIGDMVILIDKEGTIKRCNNAVKRFTEKPYTEILEKEWGELLFEHKMETDTLYENQIELCHMPTGKSFVLSSYPFKDMTGDESWTVITIHDTTELKQVTNELERKNREIDKNRNKLQFALDRLSAIIKQVLHEKGFSVRFSNPNLKKCYKVMNCSEENCPCYGKDELRCWQIVGTYCAEMVQGVFAEKIGNCVECPVFKEATTDPVYQIGEHFNNMMYILELKNRELKKAYTELKSTQTKILQQEKMACIGQLAAGVAHEINNPIGFVSSNLGTLNKYVERLTEFVHIQSDIIESLHISYVTEELKEKKNKLKLDYIIKDIIGLIKESLDGADRVRKIVQDLKSFSRVDEAEFKHADINECIRSTINIAWNELKYKTTLKEDYGDIPFTKCYPQQLNQVFMNLLVNAGQAIEKQGEIRIKSWHENSSIFISISDTGCGIPAEHHNMIFEPFFTTKEVGKGTGLGLSIIYDIVKKHNGEIMFQSEESKGTTFTVRIPIVDGA